MKSEVIKRSIVIHGRKTSISIENSFWNGLKEIAKDGRKSLSELVGAIEQERVTGSNLSSAIRVHILSHYRTLADNLTRSGTIPVVLPSSVHSATAAGHATMGSRHG
jgi:predicted DNA-binding ribbon-helix-helix protein